MTNLEGKIKTVLEDRKMAFTAKEMANPLIKNLLHLTPESMISNGRMVWIYNNCS